MSTFPTSSDISAGDTGRIGQYNNLRADVLTIGSVLTGPTIQTFTSNGTWTKPAGCRRIVVELVGGGGGGGGSRCTTVLGASGGGGGGYSRKIIDVEAIASETVTIGAGGIGGSYDGSYVYTPATAGGTTSFGAHLSATGGAIGSNASTNGGAGGVGSSGDINLTGISGGMSRSLIVSTSDIGSFAGYGGETKLNAYGRGGSGGQSAYTCPSRVAGSNGSSGIVIVTEYY